jgi:hypothetical protein
MQSLPSLPRLFLLNALFDLEIGGIATAGFKRAAAEMQSLFALSGEDHDRLLLDCAVDPAYWRYLDTCGIAHAKPFCGNWPGEYLGEAWGWNLNAVDTLQRHGARCIYPDLAVVRNVNARAFVAGLAQKHGWGAPGARFCENVQEMREILRLWRDAPLVLKPSFGNAGYGFIRRENAELDEKEMAAAAAAIEHQGGVSIEPWLNRLADISSRCVIEREGGIGALSHYQTQNNRAGAFFSVILTPSNPIIAPWRSRLDTAAFAAAEKLKEAGYFGPATIDSFVYRDLGGEAALAPVVEINARHSMSEFAFALRKKCRIDGSCMFRFISRRRHMLPDAYEALRTMLGECAFDPRKREGVMLVTPLRVCHCDGQWRQPARSAFFVTAKSASGMLSLDVQLRRKIAR